MSPVYSRARIGYKISDPLEDPYCDVYYLQRSPSCPPVPSQNKSCSVAPTPWLASPWPSLPPRRHPRAADLRRDKGWTGQLIEWQLGPAPVASRAGFFRISVSSSRRSPSILRAPAGNHLRLRGPSSGSAASAGRVERAQQAVAGALDPGGGQPRHPCRRPPGRHAAAVEPE